MIHESAVNTDLPIRHPHQFKRVCWSAILVGALVGVGLGFLINLFGLAIGLTIFTLNQAGGAIITFGGLLGMLVGTIAAMMTAGYVSGFLGRFYCPQRNLGALYGFATWSVALIISAAIAVQMSDYVMTYGRAISHSMYDVGVAKIKAPESKAATTNASTASAQDKASKMIPHKENCIAFTLFILFFIGALSSCIGGHWGMSCKRDD